ncbi:hypothetical protein G6F37_007344 [Rhizopus arrhizus]|nr:hypothetical protein G6F38_007550 [Rhizopus arrhizus]KAG1156733.1 hypothetical protein G6F37_007344 [Rhizopus arrhizus]
MFFFQPPKVTLLQNPLDGSQSKLSFQNTPFLALPTRDRFLHPVFISLTFITCPDDAILLSTVLILSGHSDGLLLGPSERLVLDSIRPLLSSLYVIPYQAFIQVFLLNQEATLTRKPTHPVSKTLANQPFLAWYPKGFMPHVSAHNGRTFNSVEGELLPSLLGSFSLNMSLVILDLCCRARPTLSKSPLQVIVARDAPSLTGRTRLSASPQRQRIQKGHPVSLDWILKAERIRGGDPPPELPLYQAILDRHEGSRQRPPPTLISPPVRGRLLTELEVHFRPSPFSPGRRRLMTFELKKLRIVKICHHHKKAN